jgi:hypothetical protein
MDLGNAGVSCNCLNRSHDGIVPFRDIRACKDVDPNLQRYQRRGTRRRGVDLHRQMSGKKTTSYDSLTSMGDWALSTLCCRCLTRRSGWIIYEHCQNMSIMAILGLPVIAVNDVVQATPGTEGSKAADQLAHHPSDSTRSVKGDISDRQEGLQSSWGYRPSQSVCWDNNPRNIQARVDRCDQWTWRVDRAHGGRSKGDFQRAGPSVSKSGREVR